MKLLNYIWMAGAALLAVSCVSEEDDLFSDSAAQRMNNAVVDNTNLLESSEEGWVMNFFPGHDGMFGGVVHTVRFKDGVSAIRSEAAEDVTEEYKSLYQVKGEQECLLTFDTYNEVFHMWSEPLGSSSTTGYESDYEFAFKHVSDNQDTITLKGKRYGQYMQLVRLKEDGAEFMQKIEAMSAVVNQFPRSVAVVKGESMDVTLNDGVLSYVVTEDAPTEVDPEAKSNTYYDISYITTLTGIRFYEPVTLGGETFQDCTYDSGTKTIYAVGADVEFPFILPAGYKEYDALAGEYTTTDASGTVYDVTVTPDGTGTGYYISGMTRSGNDVYASYNSSYGTLEIKGQSIGRWGSYYVWLCVYSEGIYANTSLGMIGRNDDSDGGLTITFRSNSSSYNVTTFVEYAFTSPAPSGGAGYLRWYSEPFTLVKK